MRTSGSSHQGLVRGDETEGYAFLLAPRPSRISLPSCPASTGWRGSRPRPGSGGDAAACRRRAQCRGAPELLDRRHDARLGLPILERPRARSTRRQAQRRRQSRTARDRQQDADVHRAVHRGLAASKQSGADVAGDVPEARLDARGAADGTLEAWKSGGPSGGSSARRARSRSPTLCHYTPTSNAAGHTTCRSRFPRTPWRRHLRPYAS